jgi:hypothetical protein
MNLRLPKDVRSVVVVRPDASGRTVSTTVHQTVRKSKGTRWLRPIEKSVRRTAEAGQVFADAYLKRHQRSNEKKKDGWLRDLGYNVYRADSKRRKKIGVMDSMIRFFL